MPLTISVALCTYNGGQFIRDQLESILAQNRLPDELVVSDDGSTDDTMAVVDEVLSAASSRMRIQRLNSTQPLGVVRNFQRATQACRSDLIVLCDQDDRWHSERVATAARRFEADGDLLLLHGDARLITGEGVVLAEGLLETLRVSRLERQRVHGGDAFATYIRRNLVTGATTVLRREVVAAAAPFPTDWMHDEWLGLVAAAIGKVDVLEEALLDYRQHANNQIGVVEPTIANRLGRILERRGDRYQKLHARAETLVQRMGNLPTSGHDREIARDKLEFERVRASLSATRILRIPTVLSALRRGWYRDLSSQGNLDVIRDLLQPA